MLKGAKLQVVVCQAGCEDLSGGAYFVCGRAIVMISGFVSVRG